MLGLRHNPHEYLTMELEIGHKENTKLLRFIAYWTNVSKGKNIIDDINKGFEDFTEYFAYMDLMYFRSEAYERCEKCSSEALANTIQYTHKRHLDPTTDCITCDNRFKGNCNYRRIAHIFK